MGPSHPEFTPLQWEFLAVMAAFEMPISLDLIGTLVPLPHSQFFEILRVGESLGWLYRDTNGAFGLSATLPGDVRQKIEGIIPTETLTKIDQIVNESHETGHLGPAPPDALPQKSADGIDTLTCLMHQLDKAFAEGKREVAEDRFKKLDVLLRQMELDPSQHSWFVAESIRIAELFTGNGITFPPMIGILQKTIAIAQQIGDQRSWAMANLLSGRLFWYQGMINEAISHLGKGKAKAEELGDRDILTYASIFIGLYYYILGYLNKAAGYLKSVTQITCENEEYIPAHEAPVLLLYCDINRGDFHRAVSTIDFFRRLSMKCQDYYTASLYRAMLGITLWVIGRRDEALFHLEDVRDHAIATDNKLCHWVSLLGLSCLYLSEGEFSKGLRFFNETISLSKRAGIANSVFHPIYLETYFNAEQAGCQLPPEWRFDHLFERIMAGPNVDLQGVALRLRAVKSKAACKDEALVLKDLQDSEKLLVECEDSFQLAKTKMEIVRYQLRRNDYQSARTLAFDVYNELAGYCDLFFPDDLEFLVEGAKTNPAAALDYGKSLDPILRILEELFSGPDSMKADWFLSTLSRFFRAERSGIFVFDEETASPDLQTARNLSRSIIGDESFGVSFEMVLACHRGKKPIVSKNVRETEGALYKGCLSVMCLPLLNGAEARAVVYFDNSYLPNCFDFVEMPMLELLVRHLSGIVEKQEMGNRDPEAAPEPGPGPGAKAVSLPQLEGFDIVVKDQKMTKILNQAARLAASEAPILILGETGVGKDVMAQWIHHNSSRRDKAFVAVDLTTIPENLMESELFGHEKGAFTGAHQQKLGRVEIADGGTLFFDEIGEIPLHLQVKLLRLLENRTFMRVGGTKTKHADFMLVAATNRSLFDEVRVGRFREDLYYRLNALVITIPPLRDRRNDILGLARHFIVHYAKKYHKQALPLTEKQESALKSYTWPGNVRELKHVIERAVLTSEEGRLEFDFSSVPAGLPGESPFSDLPTLNELQRRYIRYVLSHTGGKIGGTGGASEILDMDRTTLNSRMKKLGMS